MIVIGFRSRRPTSVPLLTAQHKALHLAWVHQNRHWPVGDWKHIILLTIRVSNYIGRMDIPLWREPPESIDPTCQHGTVQSGAASVIL